VNARDNAQSGEITRIGKYDIIDVLGRGGMGVVYRAIDKQIGREVAIKTLTDGFQGDPGMLARFYEEGRRTGRLNHPNIVTVYDLGDDEGIPYIVMECVEGDPLDKIIKHGITLSMPERLGIVEEVCSALGYAHRNNVIHRDVKPANIFVQPDGTTKLLDFGIARLEKRDHDSALTRTGNIIGTVPYMAPERLRNEEVDGRSDLFAAGVVLYQLITGQLPFTGSDAVLMQKILTDPHPPIGSIRRDLPPSLELIVDRALAKSPDDRYPTGEEMAADLTAAIADLQHEQIAELLPEAQHLVEAEDFTRARSVLHQVLKIDNKHADARRLLGEIQRHFTQRQREERIQQFRQQAEDAIANNQFDQGLSFLEGGLELDSANTELVQLQAKAKREKEKRDRINEFMRQAETARRKGDFKSAIQAAEKALKVDKTDLKIVSLCNQLSKEAEKAQKQAQAKSLLGTARGEIGSRRYNEAIELLKQIEQIDPTNPEITLLFRDANSGLDQIKRRETIAMLEEEVATSSSLEQLQQASQSIKTAMSGMPSEATLFRLSAQVDRQIKDYENRQLVDNTVQACRDLQPREALELVRNARQQLPEDERLLAMEALLADRFRQQTVEERQNDYMSRAREALKDAKYSEAVSILELCHAEGIATAEILSLLEFAHSEETEYRRQEMLRNNLSHAQSLIAEAEYDQAVGFLQAALKQTDDQALRMLLEQAGAGKQSFQRQIEAGLTSAGKLAQAGRVPDAIQFLEAQPRAIQRSARVQGALVALEEYRQQALFRFIGRAYGALESDLPAGEAVIRCVEAVTPSSPFFKSMASSLRSREQAFADRMVSDALSRCKDLIRQREKESAAQLLQTVSGLVDFSSPELKSDWQRAQKKAGIRPRS
jgi:serine/threonine-protein kinase